MEEDLSKLEKTTPHTKRKPNQLGKHPPTRIPPPFPCCPGQGRDTGCLGGEGAGCAPRAALAIRPLGPRGWSRSPLLLGSPDGAELLPQKVPQQSPVTFSDRLSLATHLWNKAPTPRRGGGNPQMARGAPLVCPPISPPVHKLLFTNAPESRMDRANSHSTAHQARSRAISLPCPTLNILPSLGAGTCGFVRSRWGARRA